MGRRWNIDPRPNASMSAYSAFSGNPIAFSDPFGDSVKHEGMYKKDPTTGEYLNKETAFAFELWASSPDGEKYLLDRAQEGYELKGIFIKDLHIKATQEGKMSKEGVDVNFMVGKIGGGGAVFRPRIVGGTEDEVGQRRKSQGARLKIDFVYPSWTNNAIWDKGNESILHSVNKVIHEPFLHGLSSENEFMDNSSSPYPLNGDHRPGYATKSFYGQSYKRILNHAETRLINDMTLRKIPLLNSLQINNVRVNEANQELMFNAGIGNVSGNGRELKNANNR